MPELVAIDGPAGPRFVDLIAETWSAGDAFAPIDPRLPPGPRQAVLDAIQPTVLVRFSHEDDRPERQPWTGGRPVADGDALVISTSGTSGRAKGVIHTHDSVRASAAATSRAMAVDPAIDHWLACLPLAHIGGLSVVLRALLTGTRLTVHPTFDPAAVTDAATNGGVNLVSLVTRALNQVPTDLFRVVLIGGAAPPDDLAANVIPTYGMTETGSGVIYGRRLLDGCQIGLRDDAGHAVDEPDRSGAILIRGPMLFRGYRHQANPFVDGDWFPTGDLGRWRDDGSLVVDGRADDVIVSGGQKIWPITLERTIATHPAVAESAVVGRPDDDWGQRVVAVVVPVDGASPPSLADIKTLVTKTLPAWWAPKELEIRTTPLPRTALGKLQRQALRLP